MTQPVLTEEDQKLVAHAMGSYHLPAAALARLVNALVLQVQELRVELALTKTALEDQQAARAQAQHALGECMATLESETAHADALSDLVDGAVLVDEPQQDWQNIPLDMAVLLVGLGPVQWTATAPMTPTEAGRHVANAMRLTSDHFQQDYQQPMQMLTFEENGTTLAYTGTSPASGLMTQAMAGAWNRLVGDCHIRLMMAKGELR